MIYLVALQATTFLPLAGLFYIAGDWKRGTAQILLGAVTALVYS